MKKISVHFTHENGGTLARVEMDSVPRIGEQVNIGKASEAPQVMKVVASKKTYFLNGS